MKSGIYAFCLISLWLVGCTTNISGDPRYDTGYRQGQVYALTQDLHGLVFRGAIIRDLRNITILPPQEYAKRVAQNDAARAEKKTTLLPVPHVNELVELPKGTRIKVTSVILTHNIESGTQMVLWAKFAGGPFDGKTAVVWEISKHRPLKDGGIFSGMLVRDPAYLEESKYPNQAPEPTPGLVTPRALECISEMKRQNVNGDVARGAPSPVVAHL